MNIKEKLQQLNALTKELGEYFDNLICNNITDFTDQYWTVFGERKYKQDNEPYIEADKVGWSHENPMNINEPDREHIYLGIVRFVLRKSEFTLVCTRLPDGTIEDLIFDNFKEIPEDKLNK